MLALDLSASTGGSGDLSPDGHASDGGIGIVPTAWYSIVNQHSNLCADDTNSSTTEGNLVQQYTCFNGNANQQWQFTPTDSGFYKVLNRTAGLLLDVTGGPSATGDGVSFAKIRSCEED